MVSTQALREAETTHGVMLAARAFLVFQHVTVDVRNHGVGIDRKLRLRQVSECQTESIERTLKTWRTLVRSRLQVAIASLSLFERKSGEAAFRLLCLMIFWIAATVLL